MDIVTIGSQILIGLSRAMLLFIVASGLTIVFGVLRVINFAHGSLYMIGAFMAYTIAAASGPGPVGFWLGLILAPAVVGLLSLAMERGLLRFIYKREHLMQMLLTYSLVLILGDGVKMIWGTQYKSMPVPDLFSGSFALLSASLPKYNGFLLIVGPLVAAGLWLLLTRTRLGKICRATATDREMVDALGIDSTRVFAAVFVVGGWLAGLGGALIAPTVNISLGMDVNVIISAFLVVVVGGLGNVWGALVSSLILGVGESLGVLIWPQMSIVMPFLITALVLILRPSGLLKSVW
ncbi:MAG: branched-chain amino acid ABC transporter permease [Bacillota bacterium]